MPTVYHECHSRSRNDGAVDYRASSDGETIEASSITFGCLNIRLITSRFEVLTDKVKYKKINISSLTETWHDDGSIAFFQLRQQEFTVVDCPRPRAGFAQSSGLRSNHGGLAVVSTSVTRHNSPVNILTKNFVS